MGPNRPTLFLQLAISAWTCGTQLYRKEKRARDWSRAVTTSSRTCRRKDTPGADATGEAAVDRGVLGALPFGVAACPGTAVLGAAAAAAAALCCCARRRSRATRAARSCSMTASARSSRDRAFPASSCRTCLLGMTADYVFRNASSPHVTWYHQIFKLSTWTIAPDTCLHGSVARRMRALTGARAHHNVTDDLHRTQLHVWHVE